MENCSWILSSLIIIDRSAFNTFAVGRDYPKVELQHPRAC